MRGAEDLSGQSKNAAQAVARIILDFTSSVLDYSFYMAGFLYFHILKSGSGQEAEGNDNIYKKGNLL